jgi:uncharacterized membrane protein
MITPKWPPLLVTTFSLLGLADSSYLAYERFSLGGSQVLGCSIFEGCDVVTSGAYSTIAGVPVALLGVFYYLFTLTITILWWKKKNDLLLNLLRMTSTVGFVASLYFVYLQAFVIQSFCSYCLLSALSSTLIFVLVLVILTSTKYRINVFKDGSCED